MKISIYLSKKRINDKKRIPIYFRISHRNKRSEISSGIFVEKKHFSESKKEVHQKHPFSENYNRQIIQTHAKLLDIVYNLKTAGINEPVIVKEIFQGAKQIDISNIINNLPPFIEWSRTYIKLKYQKKYNSRKVYIDAINFLEKFEEQNKITIQQITNKLAKQIYDFFLVNKRYHYLEKIKFLSKEFCNQFDEENHFSKYRIPFEGKKNKKCLKSRGFSKSCHFRTYSPSIQNFSRFIFVSILFRRLTFW